MQQKTLDRVPAKWLQVWSEEEITKRAGTKEPWTTEVVLAGNIFRLTCVGVSISSISKELKIHADGIRGILTRHNFPDNKISRVAANQAGKLLLFISLAKRGKGVQGCDRLTFEERYPKLSVSQETKDKMIDICR